MEQKLCRCMAAALLTLTGSVYAKGYLENPTANVVESGIGIVSGWHCSAKEITVRVDGVSLGRSGVGSVRNDTLSACGDANNGFSLLFNYNDLKPGRHEIEAHADGQLLEKRVFYTVRSADVPYRNDIRRLVSIPDFPGEGQSAVLEWRNEQQNFVVTNIVNSRSLSGTYKLRRSIISNTYQDFYDTDDPQSGYHNDSTLKISKRWKDRYSLNINDEYVLNGKIINELKSNTVTVKPDGSFEFLFDDLVLDKRGNDLTLWRARELDSPSKPGIYFLESQTDYWVKVAD